MNESYKLVYTFILYTEKNFYKIKEKRDKMRRKSYKAKKNEVSKMILRSFFAEL